MVLVLLDKLTELADAVPIARSFAGDVRGTDADDPSLRVTQRASRVSLVESSVEKPLLPDAAINAPQTFRVWPITKTPELLTFLRHPSRNSQRIKRAVAIKPQDSPVIEKIESNDRCLVYLSVDQYSSLTPKNVNTCEDQVFSNQSTGARCPVIVLNY